MTMPRMEGTSVPFADGSPLALAIRGKSANLPARQCGRCRRALGGDLRQHVGQRPGAVTIASWPVARATIATAD